MKPITIVTGGRAAKNSVYDNLAWIYQDSGLLGSLMCGALDAPELMPAGATRADDSWWRRQRPELMTSPREREMGLEPALHVQVESEGERRV